MIKNKLLLLGLLYLNSIHASDNNHEQEKELKRERKFYIVNENFKVTSPHAPTTDGSKLEFPTILSISGLAQEVPVPFVESVREDENKDDNDSCCYCILKLFNYK